MVVGARMASVPPTGTLPACWRYTKIPNVRHNSVIKTSRVPREKRRRNRCLESNSLVRCELFRSSASSSFSSIAPLVCSLLSYCSEGARDSLGARVEGGSGLGSPNKSPLVCIVGCGNAVHVNVVGAPSGAVCCLYALTPSTTQIPVVSRSNVHSENLIRVRFLESSSFERSELFKSSASSSFSSIWDSPPSIFLEYVIQKCQ